MRQQLLSFRPNLITVYVGGGNTVANDADSLTQFYDVLFDLIYTYKPQEAVVLCSYHNKVVAPIVVEMAQKYGFIPVDLRFLHQSSGAQNPYYAFTQYPDYDEAVKAGAIEFRTHPGDFGHDTIAKHIVDVALPRIKKQINPGEVCLPEQLIIAQTQQIFQSQQTVQLTVLTQPAQADDRVIWTVDDPRLATVDYNGRMTAVNNGTVTVTAQSTVDPSVKAVARIEISGQTPWYTLRYLPGTQDAVFRIPEPVSYLKDTYSLCVAREAYLPKRVGYQFMGWSDFEDLENPPRILQTVRMDRDRTLRANWRVADQWDFDGVYDSAGVKMGGFNVRYENSIASASSTVGTGVAVYHDALKLNAQEYSRFCVRMRIDCEDSESGVCLCVKTTQGEHSCIVSFTPQTMQDFTLDLSAAQGTITAFRIAPQMTECCVYVDRIAFEV